MLLPRNVTFFFVFELLNFVFLVFLFYFFFLFVLFSIILSLFFSFLNNTCRCIRTHVVLKLICRVCFFITQSDDNGFDHLIPSNVRCPVDLLNLLNVVDAVTPGFLCNTGKSFLDHLFDYCQVERQVSPTNVVAVVAWSINGDGSSTFLDRIL